MGKPILYPLVLGGVKLGLEKCNEGERNEEDNAHYNRIELQRYCELFHPSKIIQRTLAYVFLLRTYLVNESGQREVNKYEERGLLERRNQKHFNEIKWSRVNELVWRPNHCDSLIGEIR